MAVIVASAVRTCLGDGPRTFERLLAGECGVTKLRHVDAASVNVKHGYHVAGTAGEEPDLSASRWLVECLAEVLAAAGLGTSATPVPVIAGTGLRELRAAERWALDGRPMRPEQLHFAAVVREVSASLGPVLTIANACSASGHTLALAQDLVDAGQAEVVVAAGADAMTASMLAMIGRMTEHPTESIRPFDAGRTGVLLGEGAAAVVVAGDSWPGPVAAGLLGTGICCDAYHETAPSLAGITRTMREALRRAGRRPSDVDLVLCHGTGTALNDATEALAIREVLAAEGATPWLTAVKGAIGHTSGASALMSVDVAMRCLERGVVPPVVGLGEPLPEADGLRLVTGAPVRCAGRVAQVNAFGFGGVNAVSLIEARS